MKRIKVSAGTPLFIRLEIVVRHQQKFSIYPALKAAARELLTGGVKMDAVSVQPLAQGSKRAWLYEFAGVSSVDTRFSWDMGWVKEDAPIIASARIRRKGEDKWLSVPQYRETYNERDVIIGRDHPCEFGTAFWLRRD